MNDTTKHNSSTMGHIYDQNSDTENYRPEEIPLHILRAIQLAKSIFIISLTVGTLLLLAFLFTKDTGLIGIGMYYVAAAFVANAIVLTGMIVYAFHHREHLRLIVWHSAILLINIPIAYVYLLIVVGVF